MSGYQFIHVETYGKVSSNKDKPTIFSIVNEAMRVEGFCPHVSHPQTPEVLYGLDPRQLPTLAVEKASKARDAKGRKIRKDAQLMLAGVISIGSDSDVNFRYFLDLSITFLRKKYGKNLMSVVLHVLDEEHPHLHFYAIPSLNDNRFHISQIHEGIKARDACLGYSKKANAYKQAMRELQNSFYEQVGSKIGLTRLGPKVQRITRKEWKAQQKQAQALSDKRLELRRQQKEVTDTYAVVEKEKQQLDQRESELISIENTSFFQQKNKKKNDYLRKRLTKACTTNAHAIEQLEEQKEQNIKMRRELKVLKRANESYQQKFDSMAYQLDLKSQYIKQLKQLKQQYRDNNNEKKHPSRESYSYQP